MIHDQGLKL